MATRNWIMTIPMPFDAKCTLDVGFHPFPHLDELVAVFMLLTAATRSFYDRFRHHQPVKLGTGGGAFDEHARNGEPMKEGCCATLVAAALGLNTKPEWQSLIRYAQFCDTGKESRPRRKPEEYSHPFALDRRLKRRWRNARDKASAERRKLSFEEKKAVIDWVLEELADALYEGEEMEAARYIVAESELATDYPIRLPNGTNLTLLVVDSDNHSINDAARIHRGVAIVVQLRDSGNVSIFTDNKQPVDLAPVVAQLRHDELELLGRDPSQFSQAQLAADGDGPCERWHYVRRHQQIHNGTEAYYDVPATRLTGDAIRRIVCQALETSGVATPVAI